MPSPPPIDLAGIDPAIHSPARLAIMAVLADGSDVEFTFLREHLTLTDGNLAAHLKKLEDQGYVRCLKSFVGRRPRTAYRITPRGHSAFGRHLEALERLVSSASAASRLAKRRR
jgi:DNA-binding transcriptional ArsR family regulator